MDEYRLARIERRIGIIGRDISMALGALLAYIVYKAIEANWHSAWAYGIAAVVFFVGSGLLIREFER